MSFIRFEALTAVALMKTTCSSETLVEFQRTTQRYIREDKIFPTSLYICLRIHLQLVPKLRKCGSIHPFPHTPSHRSA
jgi:hypothetical protein